MWRFFAMSCLVLAPDARGQQNLVVNGDFEAGAYIGGHFMTLNENSTSLTGWRVSPGTQVRWYDVAGWASLDERHSMELNEQSPGAIFQYVPTSPATSYRLRFWLAGDPYGGVTLIRHLRVHLDTRTFDFEFDVLGWTASNMGWQERTIDFTALGSSTLLLFESLSPSFAGPAIDAVSIVATTPVCVADVDDGSGTGLPDGGVTIDDLLYYLIIFEQGLASADVDDGTSTGTPDGGVTIDDLLYYLFRFELGC